MTTPKLYGFRRVQILLDWIDEMQAKLYNERICLSQEEVQEHQENTAVFKKAVKQIHQNKIMTVTQLVQFYNMMYNEIDAANQM